MKKKLVCLTLSILMLLSCMLTGCSTSADDESSDDEAVDNSAKTITMWLMSPNIEDIVDEVLGARKEGDTSTDEERYAKARALVAQGQSRVAEQFTEITKSLFKTNVVLKFCEEDEYYEKLEGSIKALENAEKLKEEADKALRVYLAANAGGELSRAELTEKFYEENPQYSEYQDADDEDDEDASETEEETIVDDYGIASIKYPDAKANQVDIFYLSGHSRYNQYYQNEWLAALDEELKGSSSKINQYVSKSLLQGVAIDGATYGIPNNVEVGEYTYMFIDKQMYDRTYNSGADQVSTVLDLSTFLNDVKNNYYVGSEEYPEGVVPLASTFEECLKMLVWFWELDYVDASVYETKYDEEKGYNYVVVDQYSYKDGDNTITLTAPIPLPGVVYKTNDDGKFVDKDGNVLNYTYAFDSEGGYLRASSGAITYKTDNETLKTVSMYLVDENGDAVTSENDKRVMLYDSSVEATENGSKTTLSVLNYQAEEVTLTLASDRVEFSDPEDGLTTVDANGNPKPSYYYTYSTDCSFSILGQTMLDASKRSLGEIELGFNTLLTNQTFRSTYETLKDYEYNELFGTPTEGQYAAVSFRKGNYQIQGEAKANGGVYTDPETGRDYYVVVAEKPEASEQELYGNMFCVYGESNYLNRSMEVITRINTNQELRDLLQYGILGEHYELNADGTAHPLTGSQEYGAYRMDIEKTGNCFMATPHEDDGPDAWTYAKSQNNDALINPLLGFDFTSELKESENTLDVALIREIKRLSEEALAGIEACDDMEALKDLLETTGDGSYQKKYSATGGNKKLSKATKSDYDPSMPAGADGGDDQTPDLSGESPYTIYYNWMVNQKK